MTLRRSSPRAGARWSVLIGTVVAMTVLIGTAVLAGHGLASLPGSDFEIDDDANLKLDHELPSVDWGSLAHPDGPELRSTDEPTGTGDDSYKGGTKEDTECPAETTGSIPNNKSDLLTFHVYEESGDPGFLNIGWSRVSEPSGTTLMDFEFNQSTMPCEQGPNVVRTPGDLLIEYAIDQGGANAEISGRFWSGSAWGPPMDLGSPNPACGGNPCAVGTINQSPIPATESDGLGDKDARTFGEAQIDLALIFDETQCTSFGSAMLKSRSSDAFTSQLKDFISPISISLTNCGKVIIHKETDPDGATASFGFTKSFDTDPENGDTFSLSDGGTKTFDGVLFGTGYTVDETTVPPGWDFDEVDCGASMGVTPDIDGSLVTFDIDDEDDVLECTYTNRARATLIVEKVTDPSPDPLDTSFGFTATDDTDADLDGSPFSLSDGGTKTFENLVPGDYSVTEDDPSPNYALSDITCVDADDNVLGSDTVTVDLENLTVDVDLGAGETITCIFTNDLQLGRVVVNKTDDDGELRGGATFTITPTSNVVGGVVQDEELVISMTVVADGVFCTDNLVFGDYVVTETSPPDDFADAAPASQTATVSTVADCSGVDDETTPDLTFENEQLHVVIVIVCHQADDTLARSDVSDGTTSTASLSAPPAGITEAQLCALGGARYEDLEHGTVPLDLSVDVGSDAH